MTESPTTIVAGAGPGNGTVGHLCFGRSHHDGAPVVRAHDLVADHLSDVVAV